MNRLKLVILAVSAVGIAGIAAVRLAAQPQPYSPVSPGEPSYELVLPPGTYQSLLLAFEGGSNSKTLKATLKAPSGDMTVLVLGGETLVVPLSSAGWTITQPVPIKLSQPTTLVYATAIAPSGPVHLETPKK